MYFATRLKDRAAYTVIDRRPSRAAAASNHLVFKALKQHLCVETFVGIALNLVALLRMNLFV